MRPGKSYSEEESAFIAAASVTELMEAIGGDLPTLGYKLRITLNDRLKKHNAELSGESRRVFIKVLGMLDEGRYPVSGLEFTTFRSLLVETYLVRKTFWSKTNKYALMCAEDDL